MPKKVMNRNRKPRTSRFPGMQRGPRGCKICKDKIKDVDYLNVALLQRYISERGKITPSRISGNCASHQRQLAKAIKRARIMALLPFVSE
ncbi:30S ribosomal protein S18 [Candidatus Omnitrophota bacterium]